MNKSAGSTSIISNADAHWRLSKGSDSDKAYLTMPKTRGYKAVEMAYEVDFDNGVCLPLEKSGDELYNEGEYNHKEPTVRERILDCLEVSGEGVSKEELREKLQVTTSALKSALKRLVDSKQVVAVDDPENPKGKLYKLPESE